MKDFKKRHYVMMLERSLVILLNPASSNDSSNFIKRSSKRWNLFAKLPKYTEGGFSRARLVRWNPTKIRLDRILHTSWKTKSEHLTFLNTIFSSGYLKFFFMIYANSLLLKSAVLFSSARKTSFPLTRISSNERLCFSFSGGGATFPTFTLFTFSRPFCL